MNMIRGLRALLSTVRQEQDARRGFGGARFDGGFGHGFGELAGSGASGWAQTAFGEYYPRSAIVYAAIKVRQDAVARLPLRVLRRRGANRMDRMDRIGGGRDSFHPHPPSRGKGQEGPNLQLVEGEGTGGS